MRKWRVWRGDVSTRMPVLNMDILPAEITGNRSSHSICSATAIELLFCKVSGADDARIFSRLLSTQQLAWSWVTGALLVPLVLALAKSSILSCQSSEHTILVTD
ncbi:hypothetical protein EYF80_007232 [Liparis tanakae]|uniref:Uncharacterized protein n=1 Tax=Liparis tanakae TaxID=230148 RepID=A0A4Z2IXA5_9TELE|nr:hypothetical protein EYF80_007232 [Liparis tanakae]